MANELKHNSVGTELTQAEWEAVGTHVIDSQATGDIVYASSSSQLSRLGKGADNTVLHLASGIPAWSATLAGLTLTTPTISATGFANANHAHAAANSGGTLTTVGALNAGSITSGFGTINNGSSTITSTGTVSTGALSPSGTITHTGASHNHELDGSGGSVLQLISNTGTAANDVAYLELKTAGNAHGTYTAPHVRYTHGGSTYNWYTGVDLTQYEADTFYIGAGTTVGSTYAVAISRQNGRNVPGFRIDPLDFTSSGTTSDVGTYTFNSLAHNITWSSDPGDNSGAKWQINIMGGGTMVNSASAQAFTNTQAATTLSVTPPSAGSNITFTGASGINIHNVASAGTTTNLYGIYMDALSGGGTDIGLSTSNDIDLRSSGEIHNIGASGNDIGKDNWGHTVTRDDGDVSIGIRNDTATDAVGNHSTLRQSLSATNGNLSGDVRHIMQISGGLNWCVGVDNSNSDVFTISKDDTPGGSDCVRITSTKAISFDDANASYTTFSSDYACDGCGKTAISMFECCGTVAWHDDVLALRELQLSPQGLQHMAKLRIYEIDGPDDPEPGAAFINYQKATKYTWAGMYQNRARMDSQYEELNKRLEAIGA